MSNQNEIIGENLLGSFWHEHASIANIIAIKLDWSSNNLQNFHDISRVALVLAFESEIFSTGWPNAQHPDKFNGTCQCCDLMPLLLRIIISIRDKPPLHGKIPNAANWIAKYQRQIAVEPWATLQKQIGVKSKSWS